MIDNNLVYIFPFLRDVIHRQRKNNMLIRQESCVDSSASLVVYTLVLLPTLNMAMSGHDTDRSDHLFENKYTRRKKEQLRNLEMKKKSGQSQKESVGPNQSG